ncbi:hypothetical protein NEOLI_004588 [Neolecta irregularis DAH-3]|uniref:DUF1279 domain-containing protein n=1 Tax=Neolecta irregularis (strain DAH-3) TaxID=1198029 RepID=A0A1U7LJF0_NEOID|nr:hypothetical protein NEOLI_004588 [Neolecta irregularis DAH-3]|eukprot:OLL22774.1 hypothetical protein NEOLI_004588 [Neolecta irregularis DAH-3]
MSPPILFNSLQRAVFRSVLKPKSPLSGHFRRIQIQASKPAPQGFRARLKHLSDNYGWSAVGVYVALSVVDLSALFIAVRMMGADTIGHYESLVLGKLEDTFGYPTSKSNHGTNNSTKSASVWTELALAYGIHKLLIVFRVPLAAAVTPPLVKFLRRKGYNIGRKM